MTDHSFQLGGSNRKGVLLIHGLTGAPGEMKFVARRLNARGFTVHVPQLAGHGQDDAALLSTGWRDWRDSVVAAYDVLAAEVDEVHVAGICAGAALALALADLRPVKSVAAWSFAFNYDGWNITGWSRLMSIGRYLSVFPILNRVRFVQPYPFGLKDERFRRMVELSIDNLIEGGLTHIYAASMHQMYGLTRHIERIGRRIRQPALILHAREDDMSHPRNAARLQRALGGVTELKMLEDCYHMIHVDKHKLVADLSAEFFTRSGSRESDLPASAFANA